jgi:hypothetical protein
MPKTMGLWRFWAFGAEVLNIKSYPKGIVMLKLFVFYLLHG